MNTFMRQHFERNAPYFFDIDLRLTHVVDDILSASDYEAGAQIVLDRSEIHDQEVLEVLEYVPATSVQKLIGYLLNSDPTVEEPDYNLVEEEQKFIAYLDFCSAAQAQGLPKLVRYLPAVAHGCISLPPGYLEILGSGLRIDSYDLDILRGLSYILYKAHDFSASSIVSEFLSHAPESINAIPELVEKQSYNVVLYDGNHSAVISLAFAYECTAQSVNVLSIGDGTLHLDKYLSVSDLTDICFKTLLPMLGETTTGNT